MAPGGGTRFPSFAATAATAALALGLAGCGGTAVQTPVFFSLDPTASPSLTVDQLAAGDALTAFQALVADEALTFHVDVLATEKVNGRALPTTEQVLDVAGADFKGRLRMGGDTVRVVYREGTTWWKAGKSPWKKSARLSTKEAEDFTNVWRMLGDVSALEFKGRDPDRPDLFVFENARPITFQDHSFERAGAHGNVDSVTLTLQSDGTPVGYRAHMIATYISGAMADQKHDITTVVDVSGVGSDITVTAPK
jgi:hypothetical protein